MAALLLIIMLLVLTLSTGCLDLAWSVWETNYVGSRTSMVAKMNLKELKDGHHQYWSLWLNLTQHGNLT
jgi:hypothetical protein